jgi:hypothetical protein
MILSYRSDDRRQSPLLRALDEEPEADRANLLEVGPLSPDEARELVGDLLPLAPPMAIDRIRALVQEAGGSPFFIGELARFANQPTATGDAPGDLGAVIRARLEALPSEALEILELVAVSGAPIDTQLVLELSGVAGRGRPRVYELCNGSLLRASSSGREVETYHGRIRDAILDGLDDPDRRRRHRQLADGLAERPETRAATLLEHTLGAGDEAGAIPIARAPSTGPPSSTTWPGISAVAATTPGISFPSAHECWRPRGEARRRRIAGKPHPRRRGGPTPRDTCPPRSAGEPPSSTSTPGSWTKAWKPCAQPCATTASAFPATPPPQPAQRCDRGSTS